MKTFSVLVKRDDGKQIMVENVEARDKWHARTRVWLKIDGVPAGWTIDENQIEIHEITYDITEVKGA